MQEHSQVIGFKTYLKEQFLEKLERAILNNKGNDCV
jgi:hypothetical protein